MTDSRIAQYEAFLAQDPNNSFARYVIAQEHTKLGNLEEAISAYQELIELDPDYVAAYHHGGKTLERIDNFDAAKALYVRGIDTANRVGNSHARAELEEALAAIS